MPKMIIGDGGGSSGGGGGVPVSNLGASPITIADVEVLPAGGLAITTYTEQGRVVLGVSLARSWFMGQGR